MLRFPAKKMREKPELASLRQWIFSHNAAHRSIRISPPSPHVSTERTFWRALVVVTAIVSLDFFADNKEKSDIVLFFFYTKLQNIIKNKQYKEALGEKSRPG